MVARRSPKGCRTVNSWSRLASSSQAPFVISALLVLVFFSVSSRSASILANNQTTNFLNPDQSFCLPILKIDGVYINYPQYSTMLLHEKMLRNVKDHSYAKMFTAVRFMSRCLCSRRISGNTSPPLSESRAFGRDRDKI
jgi:hypothetical protein